MDEETLEELKLIKNNWNYLSAALKEKYEDQLNWIDNLDDIN